MFLGARNISMPKRVTAFFDGFNFYHALDGLEPKGKLVATDYASFKSWKNHLKWADLRAIIQSKLDPKFEVLTEVLYFSAYATWLPAKDARHKTYVGALESTGVKPVLGRFKEKDRWCMAKCKQHYVSHEEKQTDVNIALFLMNYAWQDRYDRALLVSGDSDLVPAVCKVLEIFTNKSITIVTPPFRGAKELIKASRSSRLRIELADVQSHLLADKYTHPTTGQVILRPTEYQPPTDERDWIPHIDPWGCKNNTVKQKP